MNSFLNKYSSAIIGGALISLGTLISLLFKGRIIGMSRIVTDIIYKKEPYWKGVFVLAILWITTFFRTISKNESTYFEANQTIQKNLSYSMLVITGFLLGLGTNLARGCSSEHGVSGVSRLSKISIVSKFFYIIAACIVATLDSHYKIRDFFFIFDRLVFNFICEKIPLFSRFISFINCPLLPFFSGISFNFYGDLLTSITTALLILFIYDTFVRGKNLDFEISLISGIVFGSGLIISGMNKSEINISSLSLSSKFDPTLEVIFLVSIGINLFFMNFIIYLLKKPVFSKAFDLPKEDPINSKIIIGSIIFGASFGLTGICVAPAIINLPIYFPHLMLYVLFFIIGQMTSKQLI